MLKAYFDDSGTHAGAEVVVWAGVHGSVENFEKFDTDWEAMLAAPLPGKPPLKKFSLGDCRHAEGEFQYYKPAERHALRYRVREIIQCSELRSIAFAVPMKFWNPLPGRLKRAYGGADAIAFGSCAHSAIQLSQSSGRLPIACVFDKGQQKHMLDLLREDAEHRAAEKNVPISYTFGAVVDHYGLQAADTIATEHYWRALENLSRGYVPPSNPHYVSLLKMNEPQALFLGSHDAEQLRRDFLREHPTSKYLQMTRRERMFYRPLLPTPYTEE